MTAFGLPAENSLGAAMGGRGRLRRPLVNADRVMMPMLDGSARTQGFRRKKLIFFFQRHYRAIYRIGGTRSHGGNNLRAQRAGSRRASKTSITRVLYTVDDRGLAVVAVGERELAFYAVRTNSGFRNGGGGGSTRTRRDSASTRIQRATSTDGRLMRRYRGNRGNDYRRLCMVRQVAGILSWLRWRGSRCNEIRQNTSARTERIERQV